MLCNDTVLSINRLAVVTSLLPVLQLIGIVVVVVCSSVDLLIQSLLIIYLLALSLVLVITTLSSRD